MFTLNADEEFRISVSNFGSLLGCSIYSMCLCLNLLIIPDLKL